MKPRINLAFDSDSFLNRIRARAGRDGVSITQFVNDAVAYYLDNEKARKTRKREAIMKGDRCKCPIRKASPPHLRTYNNG